MPHCGLKRYFLIWDCSKKGITFKEVLYPCHCPWLSLHLARQAHTCMQRQAHGAHRARGAMGITTICEGTTAVRHETRAMPSTAVPAAASVPSTTNHPPSRRIPARATLIPLAWGELSPPTRHLFLCGARQDRADHVQVSGGCRRPRTASWSSRCLASSRA